MKPTIVLKAKELAKHAKKIADAMARDIARGCCVVPRPVSNPTLVAHGLVKASLWHVLTHEPPRKAVADLYVGSRAEAARITRLLSNLLGGVTLDLLDNTATPADLKAHPRVTVNPSRSRAAREHRRVTRLEKKYPSVSTKRGFYAQGRRIERLSKRTERLAQERRLYANPKSPIAGVPVVSGEKLGLMMMHDDFYKTRIRPDGWREVLYRTGRGKPRVVAVFLHADDPRRTANPKRQNLTQFERYSKAMTIYRRALAANRKAGRENTRAVMDAAWVAAKAKSGFVGTTKNPTKVSREPGDWYVDLFQLNSGQWVLAHPTKDEPLHWITRAQAEKYLRSKVYNDGNYEVWKPASGRMFYLLYDGTGFPKTNPSRGKGARSHRADTRKAFKSRRILRATQARARAVMAGGSGKSELARFGYRLASHTRRASARSANPKGRNPRVAPVTLNAHEVAEFARAAKAMYARGESALGHLLSAAAAKRVMPIEQYDRAANAYRKWLVFDEPKGRSANSRGLKLKVGDRVQFTAAHLRSAGMVTGPYGRMKGTIVAIETNWSTPKARVEWDGHPEMSEGLPVDVQALKTIGHLEANPKGRNALARQHAIDRKHVIDGYVAQIMGNANQYHLGHVTHEKFHARNLELWKEIEAAGMDGAVSQALAVVRRARNPKGRILNPRVGPWERDTSKIAVTFGPREVERFRASWPLNKLPNKAITIILLANGDVYDMSLGHGDQQRASENGALQALVQDAQRAALKHRARNPRRRNPSDYVPVAEAAKQMRVALKRHFPKVKFAVRSKSYTGGASISVSYTNGPRVSDVDKIAQRFAGADFDPMIDLKSSRESVLVGADGAMRSVRYGSDYVFVTRHISDTLEGAIIDQLGAKWNTAQWATMPEYEKERMARQGLSSIAIPDGEPEDKTAARAVEAFFRGDAYRTGNPGRPNRTSARSGAAAHRRSSRARGTPSASGRRSNPASSRESAAKVVRMFEDRGPIKVKTRTVKAPAPLSGAVAQIGEVSAVVYRSKKFDGKTRDYEHEFSSPKPLLVADPHTGDLNIVRGKSRYKLTPDGIIH